MRQGEQMSDERQITDFPVTPARPVGCNAVGTERTLCLPRPVVSENDTPRLSPAELYDKLRTETPDLLMGQALRQVREHQGLTLEAIAGELRINKPYLMGIERMETSTIPSGYVTPVLRAYAKRLGLEGDRVVADYTGDCGAVATVTKAAPVAPIESRVKRQIDWRLPAMGVAAVLGIGLVGGLVVSALGGAPREAADVMVAEPMNGARESLFADVPLPERLETAPLELTLVAVADGWVEIRGADGTLYRSRVMRAGETYAPRIGAGWTVNARNGAAFEWRVGDAVVGPLGPQDTAVYAASVDTVAARAAEVATPALAAAGAGQPSR